MLVEIIEASRQLEILRDLTAMDPKAPTEYRARYAAGVRSALEAVEKARAMGEAASALAGLDPVLAAEARAKGLFSALPLLDEAAKEGATPEEVAGVQKTLDAYSGAMRAIALRVAWAHGVFTWWRVRRLLMHAGLRMNDGRPRDAA